jgi:predicted Zn-ribbon and HTH transcriptional regulator
MIYACDNCNYLFTRTSIPEACPYCEKSFIREATADEQEQFSQQNKDKPFKKGH